MNYQHLYVYIAIVAGFVGGYYSNRYAYFLGGLQKTVNLMIVSQLICLSVIISVVEKALFVQNYSVLKMREAGLSKEEIEKFSSEFSNMIDNFKEKSIKIITKQYGKHFSSLVLFKDWQTAVEYVNKNRETMVRFIKELK